jgi:hypothetical protein
MVGFREPTIQRHNRRRNVLRALMTAALPWNIYLQTVLMLEHVKFRIQSKAVDFIAVADT